jgi:hypothetical protein
MELKVIRKIFTNKSTIGELHINGKFFCYTLEDKDRYVEQGGKKEYGITAIPRGTYNVVLSFSNRFQKYLPEILNVPQFEGIRIHGGNSPESTNGCLLVGKIKMKDFIGESAKTFSAFMAELKKVEKREKITIEIA